MKTPILIAVAATLAGVVSGGCVHHGRPTKPAPVLLPTTTTARPVTPAPQPTPPPAAPTPSPTPTAATPSTGGHVVEIITRPTLASRPSTSQAAVASRGDAAVSTADVPTPKLTFDDVKRIDTSVSCAPLARLLAMKLNNIPYQRFAGYGALDFSPNLPEGTDPDAMTNDVLSREPAGTAAAIKGLIDGKADLILVARLPNDGELAAAKAAKIKLRTDLVATEALVFTVNAANPLTTVNRDELQKIFTGQAKVWKDLGDSAIPASDKIADQPITVAYRARGTGSEELLSQVLLNGAKVPELPVSSALSSDKLVLDASLEDPQTIGFSGFAYATNMRRDGRVRMLAVDNVLPEPGRVADGQYPLTTPIYAITRADLGAENDLFKLRTWLTSLNGQKTLAEAGYMPISSQAWTAVRLMGK